MNSTSTDPKGPTSPPRPTTRETVKKEQKRAEAEEVLGRHENSGPKDHKGAR